MRTFAAILLFAALAIGFNPASADHLSSDFHTVGEDGAYHFGFNDGRLARQEQRSADGVVRGAYTYVDENGQIQTVSYTADHHNGFLVSGTNVPRAAVAPAVAEAVDVLPAVEDTPEVAAAKAEHLAAVRRVQFGSSEDDSVVVAASPVEEIPQPVEYTPEVIEARAAHFNAHAAEILRNRVAVPEVNSPAVNNVMPNSHFHPDYLPYAHL